MKQYFAVGTYTEPIVYDNGTVIPVSGRGVYLCAFDAGNIDIISIAETKNPSFLTIDEKRKRIYAVCETRMLGNTPGGGLAEIAYDENGNIHPLRMLPTGGEDPCHANIAPRGEVLIVTNYTGGSVSAWPIANEITNLRMLFRHTGNGPHIRQEKPHAHSSIFLNRNDFLAVDLGTDTLYGYRITDGLVTTAPELTVKLPAGSGPRTGVCSKDGKKLYVMNELTSSITRFDISARIPARRETVAMLPDGEHREGGADLRLAPDGRTLYATERGTDTLSVFAVDQAGALKLRANIPCGGKTPRSFTIDPNGEYLLCANQDSADISVFRLACDGTPEPVSVVPFPTPVCIRFFENTLFN